MHNVHYYVVEAPNGEAACERVEEEIAGWGNENNWRTICGAVSEYNEVYQTGDGRFEPGDKDTIQLLNEEVINNTKVEITPELKKDLEAIAKGKKLESFKMYGIKQVIEALYEQSHTDMDKFHILYDSYNAGQYDEYGVTIGHDKERPANTVDFIKNSSPPNEDEDRLWVVYIDMHS